jgi:elongator complex protein 3
MTDPMERERVLGLLCAIEEMAPDDRDLMALLRRYPRPHGTYAKSQLLGAYRQLVEEGAFEKSAQIERRLRGRPVRTISGVAPVAVLTEPYACPGSCIFCPDQKGAPKSYLDGEPGVLRALQHAYDPFAQTDARISALDAIGHPTDKIELLILGGTWSAYPEDYQTWFLRRCFDAMNERTAGDLVQAQTWNETAPHRNVGLVIETRPDCVMPDEVLRLRRQGVTKVQLGVQSLDDRILTLNRRDHSVDDVRRANRRLRLAGFKIVMHWMPNLFGATPESDLEDFARIFDDPAIRPDEMKIYPTTLLEGTELYELWREGRYRPYEESQLIELLIEAKQLVAPYCRINRVMRDIPSDYIVAGTTKSNLRQIVQQKMAKRGVACSCIRCREVRGRGASIDIDDITLDIIDYETDATHEYFMQYITPSKHLAGFLRLSLPNAPRDELPIPAIRSAAMIRELHVYGPAQALGERRRGVQHRGLGTQLLEQAAELSRSEGFSELAVIAAVGTRVYYRERGFVEGDLYPTMRLDG